MLSINLRGPRLHIRRAGPEDAAAFFRWFADATVTAYLPLGGKGSLPLHEIQAYLGRVATTDRPDVAVGIDLISHGLIGIHLDEHGLCEILRQTRFQQESRAPL